MPLEVVFGPIIEQGESLSLPIELNAGDLVRVTMPAEWTTAPLTFQFSTDGQGFNDMFFLDGHEVMIKTVVPGSGVIIPQEFARAIQFIKFRSGTRGKPVPQAARREFAMAVRKGEVTPTPSK